MRLENKVAIVTGAASGIGLAIAQKFLAEGAKVIALDLGSTEGFESIICDISNHEAIEKAVAEVKEKFGRVDILINNAGIYPFKNFTEMTEADWDKVLGVNLKGTFMLTQAAAKVMPDGGKIVNISSIASLVGFEGLTHYCASKGGINGWTRALALELAPRKINVNAVAPGAIETPGLNVGLNEESKKGFLTLIPWQRIGQPEDIANATAFLASSEADYITGQVLVVDGGWTAK